MSSLDTPSQSASAPNSSTSASSNLTVVPAPTMLVAPTPAIAIANCRTPDKYFSPNSSFNEKLGSEIVKISVGQGAQKQVFHVHKNLLCNQVPVFDRMFNSEFTEGQTGEARLPEDHPKAFDRLVSWLYSDKVHDPNFNHSNYIRLFILAEKYNVVTLADKAKDAYVHAQIVGKNRPSTLQYIEAYQGTYEGSKLRVFMSRCWAYSVIVNEYGPGWKTPSLLPTGEKAQEILLDGLRLLRGIQSMSAKSKKCMINPKLAPPCDYHHHGKDEACPYTAVTKRKLDESNV